MAKKRIKLPFRKIDPEELKKQNKIPKRKNSKGNYVDSKILGDLIREYNELCLKKDTVCVLKKQCPKYDGSDDCYCKDEKLIEITEKLGQRIYEMCERISRIRSFATDYSVENQNLQYDLINIGYAKVCTKLRNMMKGNLDSSFSYITTVIKNTYRKFLKDEHKYDVLKIKREKDQK